jgi:hypothetical protein
VTVGGGGAAALLTLFFLQLLQLPVAMDEALAPVPPQTAALAAVVSIILTEIFSVILLPPLVRVAPLGLADKGITVPQVAPAQVVALVAQVLMDQAQQAEQGQPLQALLAAVAVAVAQLAEREAPVVVVAAAVVQALLEKQPVLREAQILAVVAVAVAQRLAPMAILPAPET